MISKATAEHYIWGADCDGWHLVKTPELSVIHERMPPGSTEVRHVHRVSRQFFFALEGIATIEIAGRLVVLQPQQGVEVPPGVPHQMRNESDAPIEFVVISQPPSHGDRVPAPAEDEGS
jgi:mannose-6-phosphate isomerase-like protein (cupin superfamily)